MTFSNSCKLFFFLICLQICIYYGCYLDSRTYFTSSSSQNYEIKFLALLCIDNCIQLFRVLVQSKWEDSFADHYEQQLAWKNPWAEEPGRLRSMGSLRVGNDWATSLSLFTFMHWRRKWQPTPVFLPGESQGRGSLVGCRLWGCTDSDTTEATEQQ